MTSVSDGESSRHSSSSMESSAVLPFEVKFEVIKSQPASELLNSSSEACLSDDQQTSGAVKHQKIGSSSSSKSDKFCCVCGDRALGCNFDAVSCESCKAFFRRNALKQKQAKCIFDGNCKIDMNTRRFCPRCRLKKCFDVGMNKDLILGDDEKKKRQERLRKNRPSINSGSSKTPRESTKTSDKEVAEPVSVPSTGSDSGIDSTPIVIVPETAPVTDITSVHGSEASAPVVSELNAETTNLLSMSKLVRLGKDGLSSSLSADLLSVIENSIGGTVTATLAADGPDLMRTLTTDEERVIQELVQVYDLSFTVDLEPLVHIRQLDPSLNQLVNQSSITVLRLIKFAKRLDEFAQLPQVCQIGILKGCWIHILLLRSVSLYDCQRDVWVTPRGDIPTEILKNATGFVQLHDDHVHYCTSFKSIIGDDLTVVVLLIVIVLFSPEGPHAVTRELVSNIQDRYLILLKHYLESRYTYVRAAVMFPELMSKMKELKEFANVHGKCLVDINPHEIEPIMLEILDLK